MEKYTVLRVKNFDKTVKAASIGASNKGYVLTVGKKLNGNERKDVTCGLTTNTSGVIQAVTMFPAEIFQICVNPDAENPAQREMPVAEPEDFAGKYFVPELFSTAAIALSKMEEDLLIKIQKNQITLINTQATFDIPYIEKFDLMQRPKELTIVRFTCEKAALAAALRRLSVIDSADYPDSIAMRINREEGTMKMAVVSKTNILNTSIKVSLADNFPKMNDFTLSLRKLSATANVETEEKRVTFSLFLEDGSVKECDISYTNKNTYQLIPKTPLPDIGFTIETTVASEYMFRFKTNAKELKDVMNLLTLGTTEPVGTYVRPIGDKLDIYDELKTKSARVVYREPEGVIDPEKSRFYIGSYAFIKGLSPFDEEVSITLYPSTLFLTDGTYNMMTTLARPKKEVPADENEEADVNEE